MATEADFIQLINRTNNDKHADNFYVSFFAMNANVGNFLGKQVKSVSRPSLDIEAMPVSHRGATFQDAGRTTFDDVSIVFQDDEDSLTSMLLHAQMFRQKKRYNGEYDHIFGTNKASFGKFGLKVAMLNSNGEESEAYILENCFITAFRNSESMLTDTSQRNEITVSVSFDNIQVKIFDKFVSLNG